MKKIELEIVALSHSITQSQSYAVVLGEIKGMRRLPIVIGGFEAQAIAVALEKMEPSRPLTHDLLKNVFDTVNIDLKQIIINNLKDGIFYAQLICKIDGKTVEIDSRTSDALALAVRFKCPVYTYEFILETAGIIMEDQPEEEQSKKKEKVQIESGKDTNDLTKMSVKELNDLLNKVLSNEEYERAIKIRDELEKRKKSSQ